MNLNLIEYTYTVETINGDELYDLAKFKTSWNYKNLDESDFEYIAEDAANHFWYSKDGYEYSWPLVFILHLGDKDYRFQIDTSPSVNFHVKKV